MSNGAVKKETSTKEVTRIWVNDLKMRSFSPTMVCTTLGLYLYGFILFYSSHVLCNVHVTMKLCSLNSEILVFAVLYRLISF